MKNQRRRVSYASPQGVQSSRAAGPQAYSHVALARREPRLWRTAQLTDQLAAGFRN